MRSSHVTKTVLLVALALAALAGSSGAAAEPRPAQRTFTDVRGNYVPGQVILGYRRQASRADVARVHGRVPARVSQRFTALRMEVVKLRPGSSVQGAIRRYERDPAVAFAEPNYLRSPDFTPTDDLFGDLWGLDNTGQSHPVFDIDNDGTALDSSGLTYADINAPLAWDTQMGNGTVVAVIDTGVDITHPDLTGQLWTNPDEIPGNNFDDDGNGLKDDVNGYDFANNDGNTLLDTGPHFFGYEHGTHVAGIIAGAANNGGIVGVCPGCKIMVLKIARDSDGQLLESAELAAIDYAKTMGVKIANMSFGGPGWSNAEREAIRTSHLLAVVSAGNEALDNDMYLTATAFGTEVDSPSYPASFTLSNILAVGASNDRDENAYSTECHAATGLNLSKPECAFTNWGHDSVDLAAPGVDIESSVPGNTWETFDGTSMAAPHVAGVAGLVLSEHPGYSVAQLKNAIMRSVNKPSSLKTLYIPSYVNGRPHTKTGSFSRTAGRVNAAKALTVVPTNATPLTDGNIGGARSMSTATVKGSVSWPADVNDVWKKRLTSGHVYKVTLVVPAHKDYDLLVWKPGTKEIWQLVPPSFSALQASSGHGKGVDEVVQFVAGSTGTYYFHVSAWLFNTGSYKLTVKKIA
jgi:subtilisin family serine protease